jgi:hypothetical protein
LDSKVELQAFLAYLKARRSRKPMKTSSQGA